MKSARDNPRRLVSATLRANPKRNLLLSVKTDPLRCNAKTIEIAFSP